MGSPEVLDFAQLLAPISDEQPSGCELKTDSKHSAAYYELKASREAARDAERLLERYRLAGADAAVDASGPPAAPNWQRVYDLAADILAHRSKDLWVAAWMIEALVRLHGCAGLRDGFRLVRMMCQQYWEGIHPVPDEDGYATTVAQLAGLNGEEAEGALIRPIRDMPITQSSTLSRPLSCSDYLDAQQLDQAEDPQWRSARLEQGAVSVQMFETAVRQSSREHYQHLLDDFQAARDELAQLAQVLEARCGSGPEGFSLAPPTSALADVLAECHDRVRSLARYHFPQDAAVEQPLGEGTAESTALVHVPGTSSPANDTVRNREDAFRALLKVADFFRRTEPHSPVSYALEQAVRWGRMSLPELMQDLIGDESVRKEIFRRAGIPLPSDQDR